MNLLIIESPGKKATIEGYLGPTWRVVASMGHIRALTPSIDFLEKDFEPTYEFMKEKDAAIKAIRAAAKEATVYIGSDKDLEGEAIAYSVCVLLRLNPKTAKRIVFTEVTERAVKAAIACPGVIDMDRVHAQQARAMLDMMVGFTVSPMLWGIARGLSAGRCQTPSVRLVLEREEAIARFQAETSWGVKGTFQVGGNAGAFGAVLAQDLDDEESASNYLENVHQTPHATVTATTTRPWTEGAPPPLITSTLQQQASAKWGWSPKQTMQAAQKLYEAGHITYMRTDQATLSEDAAAAARAWVTEFVGAEYVSEAPKAAKAAKAAKAPKASQAPTVSLGAQAATVSLGAQAAHEAAPAHAAAATLTAQAAHEAIRPTHFENLTVAEYQPLYHLIRQRALQSVMAPARGETFTATLRIDEDDFDWKAVTRTTLFEGWKRAGAVANLEATEEEAAEQAEDAPVALTAGMRVTWTQLRAEPKESKAPPRFTEATLVRELERHGIGRPSTYASLLATIQDRNYVVLRDTPAAAYQATEYTVVPQAMPVGRKVKKTRPAEKGKLYPTDLGRAMWRALGAVEDLFAYGFTATIEARLDRIAGHQEEWKAVLRDTWAAYKDRIAQGAGAGQGDHGGKIRTFSEVKAVMTKKGPLLLMEASAGTAQTVFLGWPEGIAFEAITEADITAFRAARTQQLGEWEGQPITKHTGKFGAYLKCGDLSIPFMAESIEETHARLAAKRAAPPPQTFGAYVIRTGPHGPYIMKQGLKKPQFVSLPAGLQVSALKEKDVEGIYRVGVEAKRGRKTAAKE
jgi:DNA topoisomerase-1